MRRGGEGGEGAGAVAGRGTVVEGGIGRRACNNLVGGGGERQAGYRNGAAANGYTYKRFLMLIIPVGAEEFVWMYYKRLCES